MFYHANFIIVYWSYHTQSGIFLVSWNFRMTLSTWHMAHSSIYPYSFINHQKSLLTVKIKVRFYEPDKNKICFSTFTCKHILSVKQQYSETLYCVVIKLWHKNHSHGSIAYEKIVGCFVYNLWFKFLQNEIIKEKTKSIFFTSSSYYHLGWHHLLKEWNNSIILKYIELSSIFMLPSTLCNVYTIFPQYAVSFIIIQVDGILNR